MKKNFEKIKLENRNQVQRGRSRKCSTKSKVDQMNIFMNNKVRIYLETPSLTWKHGYELPNITYLVAERLFGRT